ncbi:MAG TPA: site-2 protease family protein [Solirubrobacteraceae bacterium]|jgi:Zn-dependent protease|nr:site-2 protease family protein [Solirubrobacteraceae bacterium]
MPRRRTNLQLARLFGIRIGVSYSWFVVLFFLIYWLSNYYFREVLGGSRSTDYAVAVAGALGYFASLVLHELGHALVARRVGIQILGIDLWFFGGLSQMRREPQSAREELEVAAAGPAVTLLLFALCLGAAMVLASGRSVTDVVLTREGFKTTPALALIGWLGFINAALLVFNIVPAFPLDGGRIARALIWWRTGDRNRATHATGRSGQAFALALGLFGLWAFASGGSSLGLITMLLAFFLYQAASAAVLQGALGRRIQNITVGDIMDREPVTIPAEATLLDAQEQFFLRYRWPWFAVVDPARHFLGVVRQQRVDSEIAAGRPALPVADVLEVDMPVRIGEEAPLESLLGSEGLGRLGAMVAVDADGVLQGVVTLAQVRQALRPAQPARPAT